MVRMIFRHISGARATEIDVVSIGAHRELILGRASSAALRFDSRADIGVGRQHARIAWEDDRPTTFALVDLRSRNGTFVNGRRVTEEVLLAPGDVVRLGKSGPAFQVDWELEVTPSASPAPPSD
jgi:pSer/pThr/pTyr-binding forkhead associated (FHA) protein